MTRPILGDNPFFAISHLSPSKSKEYLADESRWNSAVNVIRGAKELGIDTFMISSHSETKSLLDAAGYLRPEEQLPEICLVVPNVHDLNASAASKGIFASVKNLLSGVFSFRSPGIRGLYQRSFMGQAVYSRVKYVALHNVIVDLLIGLRARLALVIFCRLTRFCGYLPVLLTLNPIALSRLNINCHAVCCYYNKVGYNVCDNPSEVVESFKQGRHPCEVWAMGILASGVVPYADIEKDDILRSFDGALVASTKLERISAMSRCLSNG